MRDACAACPTTCKLMVLGDINLDVYNPGDKQEELIVNQLEGHNLINISQKYIQRRPRRYRTRAQWTWSRKILEGGRHFSQPDYRMVGERDIQLI